MDEETGSQHDKALQDIAAALGIPVADLIAREYDSGPTPEEVDALVAVFRAVRDPGLRRAYATVLAASASRDPDDMDDAPP